MDEPDLRRFIRQYFSGYRGDPVEAPIELARELMLGSVQYARSALGHPHRRAHRRPRQLRRPGDRRLEMPALRHGAKTTANQRRAVHVRIVMRGTVAALSLHQLMAVSQHEA